MSIEVDLLRNEQAQKRLVGQVLPGEIATFSDYSQDSRSIIAVACYPDDSGGEVYYFANDGFREDAHFRAIDPEYFTDQNRLATISAGGTYERDVVTPERRIGRLFISHMLADQEG